MSDNERRILELTLEQDVLEHVEATLWEASREVSGTRSQTFLLGLRTRVRNRLVEVAMEQFDLELNAGVFDADR